MNDVGILIDVSHCGDKTTLDALEASRQPIAITHANLRRLAPRTLRNKTDDIARAVAAAGGIIGLAPYAHFLPRGADTTLGEFCDMVDATVDLVGIEHVGLGTDYFRGMSEEVIVGWTTGRWSRAVPESFDLVSAGWHGQPTPFTSWFQSPRDMPRIAEAIGDRGYSQEQVDGIMGANWLRVLRAVAGDPVEQ